MRFEPSLGRHRRRPAAQGNRRRRERAQGLVEFALVAPVLLLILLMAIDFGRALYGWVVLQNSARIAANFAGLNAEAWRDDVASVKAEYQADIRDDLDAANCSSLSPLPDPQFSDGPDTAALGGPADGIYDVGDIVVVRLTCDFDLITPIVSSILGNPVELGASSEFRIRTGDLVGFADPTRIPPPPAPCQVLVSIDRATGGNIRSGDQETFTLDAETANCSIVSYAWTFPQGTPASATTEGPHSVTFTTATNQSVDVEVEVTTDTGMTASANVSVNLRP